MDDRARTIAELTAQVAELRALNAELGRALVAADAGTPLRSAVTAAHLLSRLEAAEAVAAAAVTERDAAIAARAGVADLLAGAEVDLAVAREALSRRSVRAAQRAARAAGPVVATTRRWRGNTGT